ncbi:hypothetical protein Tco_0604726 [Tanacetum coccineum]
MNSNDLFDIYEYHTKLDMEQYTQYLEYFEQYEAMEEDEAESSVKHTRRYIARDRKLAEDKLRRDYFGDENTPPVYPEEYFRRRYFSFRRHLDELHVTWAHLEKKQTRLRTNTKTLEDLCSQSLETASQAIHDAVTTHQVTASQHSMTVSARTDSNADLEDSIMTASRLKRDASIFSSCYLFCNPFSLTTIGDENPIRTLEDYSKPSYEGYRNTIELPAGNNVVPLRSDTIRKERASNWIERLPTRSISTWEDLTTRSLLNFFPPGKDRPQKLHNNAPDVPTHMKNLGPLPSLSFAWKKTEQAFVEYASSRTDEAREGLVSEFMASQDARLSKFEVDFKQKQSEMTKKIDTMLKAITDQITCTLPSDTVKNPKLGTHSVSSARSYLTMDSQCSTQIHDSINTITIQPKQPKAIPKINEPNVEQEERQPQKTRL